MSVRTLVVLPRYQPMGVWERRIGPGPRIVWEGAALPSNTFDTILIHEDVPLDRTWIRVNVRMSLRLGGTICAFKHGNLEDQVCLDV